MTEQEIRGLEVPVQDPVVMEMGHSAEQLLHQRLHLTCTSCREIQLDSMGPEKLSW